MGWKDTVQSESSWKSSIKDDLDDVSEIQSGARGLAQGATMGFADELAGGVEALWNKAQGDPTAFGELYKKHRDESRQNFKTAEEANPISYGAGQIGGAAATALVPGLGGATLGKLAAQGAIQGLGSSEADLTEGDVTGAARDAAIGGATGLATGGLVKGAAAGLQKAAPAIQNIAEEVATNPGLTKIIKATDVADQTRGLTSKILNKFAGSDALDSTPAKVVSGVFGRKAAYSNPLSGVSQGVSDAGRVLQKGAQLTAENLPTLLPQLGRYGKVLQDAAARGSQSLAATDFVLQQQEPEYYEMRQKMQGANEDE